MSDRGFRDPSRGSLVFSVLGRGSAPFNHVGWPVGFGFTQRTQYPKITEDTAKGLYTLSYTPYLKGLRFSG